MHARLAIAALGALLLPGCFAYCPLYATSGCLERSDLDALAATGQHEQLIEHVADERSWVREEAARAIGEHRVAAGGQVLIGRLEDPGEKRYVRAAAARALADLGRTDVVPTLARLAARPDTSPEVELAALESMCRLAPHAEETKDALHTLSEDEDLLVSAAARFQARGGCGR